MLACRGVVDHRFRRAALARLAALDRLHREAAARLYAGESTDRAVAATVDGTGRLLGLTIAPAAIRVAHPERVGSQVVAAVARARLAASGDREQRIRRALVEQWCPQTR